MNPAGLHVFHLGPCLYSDLTPYSEASQMSQIDSGFERLIGLNIGYLHASALIVWKQVLWMSLHWNGWPFHWIPVNGMIYAEMSGMNCARYSTRPTNFCTSFKFCEVLQFLILDILSASACMPSLLMICPRQSILSAYRSHLSILR